MPVSVVILKGGEKVSGQFVARVEDIPPGSKKIVQLGKISVGIFNLEGEYFALLNYCPHQGAELCKGKICGTFTKSNVHQFIYDRPNEIIRCPWHGWEFDIRTGESLFSTKIRAKSYPVEVHFLQTS